MRLADFGSRTQSCEHDWRVMGIFLDRRSIMLTCRKCGEEFCKDNPSPEELSEAFYTLTCRTVDMFSSMYGSTE